MVRCIFGGCSEIKKKADQKRHIAWEYCTGIIFFPYISIGQSNFFSGGLTRQNLFETQTDRCAMWQKKKKNGIGC